MEHLVLHIVCAKHSEPMLENRYGNSIIGVGSTETTMRLGIYNGYKIESATSTSNLKLHGSVDM